MNPRQAATTKPIGQSISSPGRLLVSRKCACGQLSQGGQCSACSGKKNKNHLQRKAANESGHDSVSSDLATGVNDVLASGGQTLDSPVRSFMESRFGRDFSHVRVHNNAKAWESARSFDAQAYTYGSDIVFGAGHYTPHSKTGQTLLAHELTHVVQQNGVHTGAPDSGVQPRLEVGAVNDSSEIEADRIASLVTGPLDTHKPQIQAAMSPVLRRTPYRYTTPQRLGRDNGRRTSFDAPPRGRDQVRVHVIRYIENCPCRQVNYEREGVFYNPALNNLAIAYRYCIGGRTTDVYARLRSNAQAFLSGSAPPTGTASVGIDINLRGRRSGGRVLVEAIGTNEGAGEGVGGRALLVYRSGGWRVFLEPQFIRRLRTLASGTQNELQFSLGAQIGDVTIRLSALNLLDPSQARGQLSVCPVTVGSLSLCATGQVGPGGAWQITGGLRAPLSVPDTDRQICRNCFCPPPVRNYECIEDVVPRDEEVPYIAQVPHQNEYRYYFRLDTTRPSESSSLRAQSNRNLDALATEVSAGGRVTTISGYASPEAGERHNSALSLNRANRMRELIRAKIGAAEHTLEPEGGGELLGRRPTVAPSSRLGAAIRGNGFRSAEELSMFLLGEEIPNAELGQQFVSLFNALPDNADRLAVFGLSDTDPIAPQVLTSVERFLRTGGRGYRPWERIFRLLRMAVGKVVRIIPEQRSRTVRHRGSVDEMTRADCQPYIDRAEQANRFGPVDPSALRPTTTTDDSNSDCLLRPRPAELRRGCNYDLPESMRRPFRGPSYAPRRLRR